MAKSVDGLTVDRKLSEIFKEGYDLYQNLETTTLPFNSESFQNDVKKCIGLFEDSTRLVSLIGMFSPNEHADEIPTEYLQYLLLPFLLGQLSSKIQAPDGAASFTATRLDCLKVAEVYYKDFIKRCEDYEFAKRESEIVPVESSSQNEVDNLLQSAMKRNTKIEKYRQKKELNEELARLKIAIEQESIDDEIKRNFFVKLITASVLTAKEELESMRMELQILEMRKFSDADERKSVEDASSTNPHNHHHNHRHQYRPEPLKPIIITRNEAQKKIFGMGYPSLPIMTVKDFYDERVREGIFPDPEKAKNMKPMTGEKTEEDEEAEKAHNEALEEADDEQHLQRRRNFDEYKDNVRRGDGNRHNRS